MVEECAPVAAKVLRMSVNEVKLYARCDDEGSFVYFWNPENNGGTVIVSLKDKTFLSAKSSTPYSALLKAFKEGYRS